MKKKLYKHCHYYTLMNKNVHYKKFSFYQNKNEEMTKSSLNKMITLI